MEITTTDSRIVYSNRWMRVREDHIRRADGSPGLYGVVDKPDFSLVVPVDATGFHLVEQYRYPVGARYWEFPQGTWEEHLDADPLDVAREELESETGLRAGAMRSLGQVFGAYGLTGQRCHVFVATDLTTGRRRLEPEELGLRSRHVGFAEFAAMAADGRIGDAATLAAYSLLMLDRGLALGAEHFATHRPTTRPESTSTPPSRPASSDVVASRRLRGR